MNSHGSTQREAATPLQRAARDGFPVLIPGALEIRANSPAAGSSTLAGPRTFLHTETAANRARLEREREGGGAPSERAGLRPRNVRAWLGEWFDRGIDLLRSDPAGTPAGDDRR